MDVLLETNMITEYVCPSGNTVPVRVTSWQGDQPLDWNPQENQLGVVGVLDWDPPTQNP
jgi:hypothetical protein